MKKIDWKEIRENYFKECTTITPSEPGLKKVNMSAHNLFEWFKAEIEEYLKQTDIRVTKQ